MRHAAVFFAVALLGAGLDLLTKHLAFQRVHSFGDEIPVIEGFFSIGKTTNPGVIFGIGPGARTVWLVVSILAVPAILAIFFSLKKSKWILTIALGLILAGTIGNMYDRVMPPYHAVRDFIKIYYKTHVWPLFNLADSFICIGVFLLSIEMLFFDDKKKPASAEAAAGKAGSAEASPAPPAAGLPAVADPGAAEAGPAEGSKPTEPAPPPPPGP